MHRRGVLLVLVIVAAGLLAHPISADGHAEVPVGPADTRRHSPSVAVDSTDPNKVVVATHDADRGDMRLFTSRDGGRSFAEAAAPKPYGWHRYQPKALLVGGRLYLTYAAHDDDEAAIVVVRSDDLGTTWERPRYAMRTIAETKDACIYPFSPSVAIHPARPSAVFVAWESWDYLNGCEEELVRTFVARSDDGGVRFARPVEVALPDREDGDWMYYPQLVALPDGGVAVAADVDRWSSNRNCPGSYPQDVVVAVSNDAGRSFRSHTLAEACSPTHLWRYTPVALVSISPTGGTYYFGARVALAAHPRTRGLTAAWIAANGPGISRLSTAYSPDGGQTWHDAGAPSEPEVNQQHFPTLASGPDGTVAAVYVAQLPGGVVEPRLSVANPAGQWSAPVALATRPGVSHESPVRGTYVAVYSYFGNATSVAVGPDGTVHPAWVDLRERRIGPAPVPYQVFTRRVGLAE